MSTSTVMAPPDGQLLSPSKASSVEHQDNGERTPTAPTRLSHTNTRSNSGSPARNRSLSDAPKLSPSPAFREPSRLSKDDTSIVNPVTPRRPKFHIRGLSLQMPPRDVSGTGASDILPHQIPLSPKLDSSQTYGASPSMLPRRSRGLDYTRACTNLHHSTLAESSPDASPTIGGRGIQIPQRRSLGNTVLDSPSNVSSSLWSMMPSGDKTTLSSSVSSVNMLDSGSDSAGSSEDEGMEHDNDDPILSTPQVIKLSSNFITGTTHSPGGEWMRNQFSPAAASLMSHQRARLHKGRSRHSSSSLSGRSAKPSPVPLSPPLMKSIESTNGGYFSNNLTKNQVQSRRESLSLGTNELHLSDSDDADVRGAETIDQALSSGTPNADRPVGVIRRPVTRRGNLLPKTKNFARVRAALLEESAPIESEVRNEAAVILQVREHDPTIPSNKSPPLPPSAPTSQDLAFESPDEEISDDKVPDPTIPPLTTIFSRHAAAHSAGLGFWNAFDEHFRTPPPPTLLPRESSSGMSDETMETPPSSLGAATEASLAKLASLSRSRSSTPLAGPVAPPTAGDIARKVNNKRRRDDDFDPASFKRRAVSPGMSVQSSPVLPQSPVLTAEKAWGHPPPKANGHGHGAGERNGSGGSVNGNGVGAKRVGVQGMVETNDSLMNMSIE